MQIIDLFSGIGGFSLAGHWAGWRTIQFCEIDPHCRRVLKYWFPNIPIEFDIKNLTGEKIKKNENYNPNESIIVVGGFPCQPFSVAGQRNGSEDDRHLWPEMFRIIKEVKPEWVVGENVPGILTIESGMVFEQVCLDLESEGYTVQAFNIPAIGKDAPHRRERIWIVAHSNKVRECAEFRDVSEKDGEIPKRHNNAKFSYTDSEYGNTNTEEAGSPLLRKRKQAQVAKFRSTGSYGDATDPDKGGRKKNDQELKTRKFEQNIPDWSNFPTQSPICGGDDGIPRRLANITFPKWRAEAIGMAGNSIVPQIAFEIFKIINHCNHA